MAFEIEMPESTDRGGSFLDQAGTYHFSVTAIDEQPTDNSGKLIEGFKVSCAVLTGTTPGQEKKETELTFWNPKLTDKNNGEFAKKKQARFVMAVGLLDTARKGGEKVSIDLQQAIGRQFIATMEERKYKDRSGNDKTAIDLHFADLWHVDDPEAAAYPKHEAALKLLPASLRKKPEQFGKPANGTANGTANGAANANGSKPSGSASAGTAAAPAGTVNSMIDEL